MLRRYIYARAYVLCVLYKIIVNGSSSIGNYVALRRVEFKRSGRIRISAHVKAELSIYLCIFFFRRLMFLNLGCSGI